MKSELKIRVDLYLPVKDNINLNKLNFTDICTLTTLIFKTNITDLDEKIMQKQSTDDEEINNQIHDIIKLVESNEIKLKIHLYIPVCNSLEEKDTLCLAQEICCRLFTDTKNKFKNNNYFDMKNIEYHLLKSEIEIFE